MDVVAPIVAVSVPLAVGPLRAFVAVSGYVLWKVAVTARAPAIVTEHCTAVGWLWHPSVPVVPVAAHPMNREVASAVAVSMIVEL